MKRLFLALSALALTAACSQDEFVEEAQPTSYDLTVTATMPEADTRTYVNGTTVYWDAHDKITIVSQNNQCSATLTINGASISTPSTSATFSGTVTFDPSSLNNGTAYYTPESNNINFSYTTGSIQTYELKKNATYDYTYTAESKLMSSYSPMTGSFSYDADTGKGSVTFEHTAALMRIVLKGVPELTSGTLKLTGTTSSSVTSTFIQTHYTWQVTFSNEDTNNSADDMTFDIPIPAETAKKYEATISVDNGTTWKTIGSCETTASSPVAGQMVVMEAKDYETLFTYNLTVNATTTDYSNPTSEES